MISSPWWAELRPPAVWSFCRYKDPGAASSQRSEFPWLLKQIGWAFKPSLERVGHLGWDAKMPRCTAPVCLLPSENMQGDKPCIHPEQAAAECLCHPVREAKHRSGWKVTICHDAQQCCPPWFTCRAQWGAKPEGQPMSTAAPRGDLERCEPDEERSTLGWIFVWVKWGDFFWFRWEKTFNLWLLKFFFSLGVGSSKMNQ